MSAQKIILICLVLLMGICTNIAKAELRIPVTQGQKELISTPATTETKASSKAQVPLVVPKFRFVAFGDYQGGGTYPLGGNYQDGTNEILKHLRCQAGCPEPNFYINTGDISTLSLFSNQFPYGKLYPARGNNDDQIWASIYPFDLPTKNYYSFTHLNTHFVMLYSGKSDASDQFPPKSPNLDCNNLPPNPSQTDWFYCDLESVRNNALVDNIIVVLHMPPLSYGGYGSNTVESNVLIPIFKTHPKLRAVLSGHNHFYQRLLKDYIDYDNNDGINYLVIGGAGVTLYDPDPNPHTEVKKQAKQYHFTIFDVDGSKVTLSVIGYNNQQVFTPIEKVDLSCKDGDIRTGKVCRIGNRKGVWTERCVKGTWVPRYCLLSN